MESALFPLLVTATWIGVVHTLLGPDHYLPFIALAKARSWTLRKTALVTLACGAGHVFGSLVLGLLGIGLGWALAGVEAFEASRGEIAGWLLLSFGLVYTAWGLKRASRNQVHTHWHQHGDGTTHSHDHHHEGPHLHVHEVKGDGGLAVTPWILFAIFVFGPCEALVPVLMYPAAQGNWLGLALVAGVFAAATLTTMTCAVLLGVRGVSGLRWKNIERYSHALAGMMIVACGLLVRLGL